MKRRLLVVIFLAFLIIDGIAAQSDVKQISFEHFTESRGDSDTSLLLEIPYSQLIVLENALNTRSGFGMRLNFNGTMVIVDQMEVLLDGRTQVVLRREDGRNFYGYRPTIKAVLSNNPTHEKQSTQLAKTE